MKNLDSMRGGKVVLSVFVAATLCIGVPHTAEAGSFAAELGRALSKASHLHAPPPRKWTLETPRSDADQITNDARSSLLRAARIALGAHRSYERACDQSLMTPDALGNCGQATEGARHPSFFDDFPQFAGPFALAADSERRRACDEPQTAPDAFQNCRQATERAQDPWLLRDAEPLNNLKAANY